MAGLRGNVQSLKNFSARLRDLPRTLAIRVAEAAAPALTATARATFDAGANAYGVTWAPLEDGSRATLKKSGGIERGVFYVAIGTKLRVKIAVAWAKFVLGKRPIFPGQNAALPTAYVKTLADTAARVTTDALRGNS